MAKELHLDGDFVTTHIQQFAGARTNLYALIVARQICQDFKLSVAGQRRLNKALLDLPCLESNDGELSFGWSYEHVIRSSQVHRTGYEHLTVLTTLAECFHETYAAEVFHEMARTSLPKSWITPHIYTWVDLVHFCSGILASDSFTLQVETFISMDPFSITPGSKYAAERCAVPAKSFADALMAFIGLTAGKRESLTLRGGGVIGWLAALAEQFSDISFSITSSAGDHLYGASNDVPLHLIYTDKPELHVQDESMSVLTRQISSISMSRPYSSQIHFLPFGGRLTWQNALPQIFGDKFHLLAHKHSQLMYVAIGSAFRAIEGGHPQESSSSPSNGLVNQPAAITAAQLIKSTTAYFPELGRGVGKLERQLRLSGEEAAQTHSDSIQEIAEVCDCVICTKKPRPSISEGSDDTTGYCLTSIVDTIITLGLLLSRVVLVLPLSPTREGIQLLYRDRTKAITKRQQSAPAASESTPTADMYNNILSAPTSVIARMAVKIFAGGHLPKLGTDDLPYETVAISHEGVCGFAAELAGGHNIRKDMQGMIRVIPGAFSARSKTYRLAVWSKRKPGGREGWQWEEIKLPLLESQNGYRLWFK